MDFVCICHRTNHRIVSICELAYLGFSFADMYIMQTMTSFLSRKTPVIRIATWNIDSRLDSRPARLKAIVGTLQALDLDVVCLQECWVGVEVDIANALGMQTTTFYETETRSGGFGNAVISRFPLASDAKPEHIELPPNQGERAKASTVVSLILKSPSGRLWRVGSTHLAWGGFSEGSRLKQIQAIERIARQSEITSTEELVQVICGDFNAQPGSSTLRYITGSDADAEGNSTLWVDAWATREIAPGYTSTNDNPMSVATARSVGILDPSLIPNRRIDYIFTRGYAYGKPGCPLDVKLLDRPFENQYGSDHYGIVANLWDPALTI